MVTNQAKAAEAAERAAFCRGELDEVVDHKKIVFKIYEIYERRWSREPLKYCPVDFVSVDLRLQCYNVFHQHHRMITAAKIIVLKLLFGNVMCLYEANIVANDIC